jgi:hypothetical protein
MFVRRASGFIEPYQPSKVAAFLAGFEPLIEKVRRRRAAMRG